MPSIGTPEIIIILAVALIVFGPKKLPEIGKSIGQGLRELRKASREIMDGFDLEADDDEPRYRRVTTPAVTTPPLDLPDEGEPVSTAKETAQNVPDSDRTE